MAASAEKRFWQKVDATPDENGCLNWLGACRGGDLDHGVFWDGDKYIGAYVFAYKLVRGEIPFGKQVLHKCDNGKCVNYEHLRLGSQRENIIDMVTKQRQAFGERNGSAKLSEEKVIFALDLISKGLSDGEVANYTGIGRLAILRIRKNITWKHIARLNIVRKPRRIL
jgi:hypothetical protein